MWWPLVQAHYTFLRGGNLSQVANCFSGLFVSGAFCFGGYFVSGAICFGELLVSGHFVSGRFCSSWLFDLGAYDPVDFVRGFLQGAFDLEPFIIYEHTRSTEDDS